MTGVELYDSRTVTVNEIASQYNVGRTAIYRALDSTKAEKQKEEVPDAGRPVPGRP
ncbi:hypothetical protein OZX62_09005 [Bifidobacterium sp. ESL0690]|uniref:hypothetical protein n=1 Tax=Bifidobacterium sp. ESL0690 TaxID=2983214 RepID=UPI0023F9604D|nr:hypothetical protein [Bifidobacterium sp. ESL0690]WEV46555.1 hypothetical protein OZX62_09005 [Bifidobacterium sp. ESL0690]